MKPLQGFRIVEFEGIGPGPLAARILADMGAEVTLIVRPTRGVLDQALGFSGDSPLHRGKTVQVLDLKQESDRAKALDIVAICDALVEGSRPGVMERLSLGPNDCAQRNERLVYGRMTGWGQTGPLSQAAGHDLNYVALTGLLSLSANKGETPILPPTVVGDAAGALGLAFGIVCALHAVRGGAKGCVVDGAIVDIVAMLGSIAQWVRASGGLDGADPSPFHESPFYSVYTCADGERITLGALEPQFYAQLLLKLGVVNVDPASQYDKAGWPGLRMQFARIFASHPRTHWCSLLEGSDVCFAPVLSMADAAVHPHNVARGIYRVHADGSIEAASAPRFQPLADAQQSQEVL